MNISKLLIGVILLLLSQITWSEVAKISDINTLKNTEIDNTIRFQFIELDKGITILPTEKQLKQQRDHIEWKSVGKSSSFNEGVISLTAHIAPGQVARKNVPLQFCMKVDDYDCKDILVWNSQQQNFVKNLTVSNIPTDVEASIHISLLLSDELVTLLRPSVTDGPASYQIFAKSSKYLENPLQARSSKLPAPQMNVITEMTSVYLVNISDDTPQDYQQRFAGLSYEVFGKEFSKGFKNEHFGLKLGLDGAANIYFREVDNEEKNEKDENYAKCKSINDNIKKLNKNLKDLKTTLASLTDKQSNKDLLKEIDQTKSAIEEWKKQLKDEKCPNNKTWAAGSKIDAGAGLDMFILGRDIKKLVYLNSWANVDSHTETPYLEVSMKVLNRELFWRAWEWKMEKGDTEMKRYVAKDRLDDPLDGLSEIKSFDDIKDALDKGVDLRMDIAGVLKYELKKEKSNYYFVYVVPVRVKAGVSGSIATNGTLGALIQAGSGEAHLNLYAKDVGPKIDFGAMASAGVSLVVVTAGVDLNLTVLSNLFGIDAGFDIIKMIKGKNIKEFANISIFNEITGPNGNIGLFVEYPEFNWTGWTPTFEQVTKRKNLVEWSTFKKKYTLYQAGNSDLPTSLEDFQKGLTGSSEVAPLKIIKGTATDENSWKPTASGENWVCLYDARLSDSKQPRGNGYCFPITAKDVLKQGKFTNIPLKTAFSGKKDISLSNLAAIKLFTDNKGLRLSTYTGEKYTGNKITYIAHGEESFNIDSDFTTQSLTISRPLEKKTSAHANKYCVYRDADTDDTSQHLCLSESKNMAKTEYIYLNSISSIKVFDTQVEIRDTLTKQFQRWYLDEGEWDKANLPLLNNMVDIVEIDKTSAPYILPQEVAVRGAPGSWGDWASMTSYCPTGQFVKNIKLKVEKDLGDNNDEDDTGANGITFWCDAPGYKGASYGSILTSKEARWSKYGDWTKSSSGYGCVTPEGMNTVSNKIRVKIMDQQGGDYDDYGMTHADLGCASNAKNSWEIGDGYFANINKIVTRDHTHVIRTSVLECPEKTAICGFKTRVEKDQRGGDDTALNGIIISCCQR